MNNKTKEELLVTAIEKTVKGLRRELEEGILGETEDYEMGYKAALYKIENEMKRLKGAILLGEPFGYSK